MAPWFTPSPRRPRLTQLVHNLSLRTSSVAVCVWCRDDLPRIEAVLCQGCQAGYHGDCAGELRRCGVSGCRQELRRWRPTPTETPRTLITTRRWQRTRRRPTAAFPEVVGTRQPEEATSRAWIAGFLLSALLPFVVYVCVHPWFQVSEVTGMWRDDLKPIVALLASILPFCFLLGSKLPNLEE